MALHYTAMKNYDGEIRLEQTGSSADNNILVSYRGTFEKQDLETLSERLNAKYTNLDVINGQQVASFISL